MSLVCNLTLFGKIITVNKYQIRLSSLLLPLNSSLTLLCTKSTCSSII